MRNAGSKVTSFVLVVGLFLLFVFPQVASAHRSGCHRWHSCPSDSGSYTCGDLGYSTYCGNDSSSPVNYSSVSEDTDPEAGDEISLFVKVNNSYSWSWKRTRRINGIVLVPAEDIFKALSAKVVWIPNSSTMTVVHGFRNIHLTARSRTALISGVPFTLPTPPALAKGVLYIPLSFVTDALGAAVTKSEFTDTLSVSLANVPTPPVNSEHAHVKTVIDGNTIELDNGLQVRLIGVDTPAPEDVFGVEALDFVTSILTDIDVYLEFDEQREDQDGRQLAYVWLPDGQMVNAAMVREGMAEIVANPPNIKYVDTFAALLKTAWEDRRGMWDR